MNMLSLIQHFCSRTNLSVPQTVYGTSDKQARQILALLEEEGADLSARGEWEVLTNEKTHTTLAQEDQGAMTAIASNGFRYIKNDTIWDRNLQEPVYGGISGREWQALKATAVTGPRYQFRIRGGHLLANPVPVAGHVWAFEYISENWITDLNGGNPKQFFTSDTDLMLLPNNLLLMGLRWRFKKEEGLEYAEDFRTYEMQVKDALSRDGAKRKLNMGCIDGGKSPNVFIPAGSWALP